MAIFGMVAAFVSPGIAQTNVPGADSGDPIVAAADSAVQWAEGTTEVWVLRGRFRLQQGSQSAQGNEAVLWIDRAGRREASRGRVVAYLEDETGQAWLARLDTTGGVEVHVSRVASPLGEKPAIYSRALGRRKHDLDVPVRTAGHAEPVGSTERGGPANEGGQVRPVQRVEPVHSGASATPAASVTRTIQVFPRSDVPVQFHWERDRATNQWIAVIDQGVNLIVSGLGEVGFGPIEISTIDVSTDRLVLWTSGIEEPDLTGKRALPDDVPLEIYMEGNIIFREGDRVIYAERMYYDVNQRVGIVLNAELLMPIPEYSGRLRLRSEVIQQTGKDRFFARNTFISSSRMGRPGYRIEARDTYLEDRQRQAVDPLTGAPLRDPETGALVYEHQRLATGKNNFLYLGEVPIFYWPSWATDLTDPAFYLRRANVRNDNVFGTQVLTTWNAYQLLGVRDPPEGTDWDINFDYLSDRGFGHGTTFTYGRGDFLGIPGPSAGLVDYWGIQDDGLDNLGRTRRSLVPEKGYRHRLFWQHRQLLPGDLQVSAEVGWISDINFLEQYYEREYDELKDEITGVELKQLLGNASWGLTADYRMNDFFTQSEWLPRADHFWLGQSLLGDALTWYEHTHVGYAGFHTAETPDTLLPWERTPAGDPVSLRRERFATRQEIDLPVQLGPVKVVPYALGEFAHWGQDLNGDDVQRLYGQAGIRASVPIWKVNPRVENDLFNVHGLAHKVVFDIDLSWADANRDLATLPLYDPLDDDSIEAFRRRFSPVLRSLDQLDERFYAVRTGLAGWVTSPAPEIADDLVSCRLGMRQRWQTKRGMPGRRRIVDWIMLDTHAVFFPEKDRDNFGTTLGLVDYDFRWHVGDRTTLVSEGAFDFFDSGQRVITVGAFLERPPRGSFYAGLHLLEGPFSSNVLSLAYSYQLTDKWLSSFGTSIDLRGEGNIGQNFSVTRIGESLLVSAGFTVDASRNNVGLHLAIEPRFLPKGRLGRAGGARIPAAGAHGLE